MQTYKKFKILPKSINGLFLLKHLNKSDSYDMYKHFFYIDESVDINFDYLPVPLTNDDQHTIYKEEYSQYYTPFFKRYFNLNPNVKDKIDFLIEKYNLDLDNLISVVYRSTDKWTDMGGFNYISPALYYRLAQKLKSVNENHKILIQSESSGISSTFKNGLGAISINETLFPTTDEYPLFISLNENKIEWSEYYIASLFICAKSKFLITYTGNSAFFLYLFRGTTKNLYQEITFTKKDENDFFVNNNN
jgi:hypothetical protein